VASDDFACIQAEMVSLPDVEQHHGQVFILHFSLDSVKTEDLPLLFIFFKATIHNALKLSHGEVPKIEKHITVIT